MKKLLLLIAGIASLALTSVNAQEIQQQTARHVAQSFLDLKSQEASINSITTFVGNEKLLAWVINLEPAGFILVSPVKEIRPVMAYSFESPWLCEDENQMTFTTLMRTHLQSIINHPDQTRAYQEKCQLEWKMYEVEDFSDDRFEQWPPEGTTPTGGWLFTNWTQSAPYNAMCPIDPNTHQRSYAGCPATAMSQILNCIISINNTRFDDGDDYWHNFGSGNQYWIDDDWEEHGFPCFDTLNAYLNLVEENYASNKPLSNDEIAALTFACGTALKQVYSSSISGTFGIEQARDAFQRFGFEDSRLVYSSDTMLNYDLAQNIMLGNPAQLGLIDPPHTVGHNVVVDGYNTDEFFHFNFGWGGNSNGWYTMPPTSAPYNLTVIEGIVLDIRGNNPHVSVNEISSDGDGIQAYINNENAVTIINNSQKAIHPTINIYDGLGKLLVRSKVHSIETADKIQIPVPSSYHGLLVVQVVSHKKQIKTFKLCKMK